MISLSGTRDAYVVYDNQGHWLCDLAGTFVEQVSRTADVSMTEAALLIATWVTRPRGR